MEHDLAPVLIPATIDDYSIILNMSRFYIYDLSRDCGFTSKKWGLPFDGLYESIDLKSYFRELDRKAFLIKVDAEIAGFVMLNQAVVFKETKWNVGEFFILAKYQGKNISEKVAYQIWNEHPGAWEVHVIPENNRGLFFWRKAILNFTGNNYLEGLQDIDYDTDLPKRVIFRFNTQKCKTDKNKREISVRPADSKDISSIVELSYKKRRSYEKAQPQFWAYARGAESIQKKWFNKILVQENYSILIAENHGSIVGFVIGNFIKAPKVYNPGGLTLLIDDFYVEAIHQWQSIGTELINNLKCIGKTKGVSQILVVCGAHDLPKRQFLKKLGLNVASEWYVGEII